MVQSSEWKNLENAFRMQASIADHSFSIFYPVSSHNASTYLFGDSLFTVLAPFLNIRDLRVQMPGGPPYWRFIFELSQRNEAAEEVFKSVARVAARQFPGCPTGLDSSWQYWVSILNLKSPRSERWVNPQANLDAVALKSAILPRSCDVGNIYSTNATPSISDMITSNVNCNRDPGLTTEEVDTIFSRETVFCAIEPLFQASAELCLYFWSLDPSELETELATMTSENSCSASQSPLPSHTSEELAYQLVSGESHAKLDHSTSNDSSTKTAVQRSVRAFRDRVSNTTAQKITFDEISLVSGYKDETTLRFYRNRQKPVALDARRAFEKTQRMESDDFLRVLRRKVYELTVSDSMKTELETRVLRRWRLS